MDSSRTLVVIILVGLLAASTAPAADKGTTTIEISKLHCANCAKKVQKKLQEVADVSSATVDAKTSRATVQSAKDKKASAKLLWEAVEASGYKPRKLITPDGTFTSKPKA